MEISRKARQQARQQALASGNLPTAQRFRPRRSAGSMTLSIPIGSLVTPAAGASFNIMDSRLKWHRVDHTDVLILLEKGVDVMLDDVMYTYTSTPAQPGQPSWAIVMHPVLGECAVMPSDSKRLRDAGGG